MVSIKSPSNWVRTCSDMSISVPVRAESRAILIIFYLAGKEKTT
jgi:hypothetical protein